MKTKGYKTEKYVDNTPTGFITDFEFNLPLKKIDIDEYERRLKKLVEPGSKAFITEQQLIESFKDQVYFKDIVDENSLTRKIMTHKFFWRDSDKGFYIPSLLLLGNLYCASNNQTRA